MVEKYWDEAEERYRNKVVNVLPPEKTEAETDFEEAEEDFESIPF